MNPRLLVVSLALVLTPLGCEEDSSSAPDTEGPDGQTEGTAGQTEGPDGETDGPDIGEGVAWAEKSLEQRGAYMQLEVVPAVSELWAQSPTPDQEITCVTCHGPAAAQGDFTMPSPSLPPLDPTNEFEAHAPEAAWLQFMGTQLTPQMTELLDAEPFDVETNEGFGCFSCHTIAG